MTIHPLPGGVARPDSPRPAAPGSPSPVQPDAESAAAADRAPASDVVELSALARALQAREGADLPPTQQLPPERLQQIAHRLAEGFYDRPEVLERAAERVLDALERGEA